MAHVGSVSGDVNVEVLLGGLQVDGIVEVHALLVLQLPVLPHQVPSHHGHGQQH